MVSTNAIIDKNELCILWLIFNNYYSLPHCWFGWWPWICTSFFGQNLSTFTTLSTSPHEIGLICTIHVMSSLCTIWICTWKLKQMAHMIIQQICVICLENCYIPQFGFLDALSFLCLVSLPLLSAINTKVAWCHRMLCHCSAPNNKNKRRCTSKACRSCQTFPLFKTCRRPKTPNPDNSFFWLPWDFKSCKKMAH